MLAEDQLSYYQATAVLPRSHTHTEGPDHSRKEDNVP